MSSSSHHHPHRRSRTVSFSLPPEHTHRASRARTQSVHHPRPVQALQPTVPQTILQPATHNHHPTTALQPFHATPTTNNPLHPCTSTPTVQISLPPTGIDLASPAGAVFLTQLDNLAAEIHRLAADGRQLAQFERDLRHACAMSSTITTVAGMNATVATAGNPVVVVCQCGGGVNGVGQQLVHVPVQQPGTVVSVPHPGQMQLVPVPMQAVVGGSVVVPAANMVVGAPAATVVVVTPPCPQVAGHLHYHYPAVYSGQCFGGMPMPVAMPVVGAPGVATYVPGRVVGEVRVAGV